MPLGRWALDEACRQMKEWAAQDIAPKLMAVNVSGLQFRVSSDLERNIADSLAKYGIAPELLELELTELVLMEAAQQHSDCFDRSRRLGVRIAIDDFGTGYSSLHYLTTYRVNQVKIAQQLVSRVDSDFRNATVVRAAVRLARDLDIGCIAEGVELGSTGRISAICRLRLCTGLLLSAARLMPNALGRTAPPGRSRTEIKPVAHRQDNGCRVGAAVAPYDAHKAQPAAAAQTRPLTQDSRLIWLLLDLALTWPSADPTPRPGSTRCHPACRACGPKSTAGCCRCRR